MSTAGEDAEEMPMGVPAAAAKPWTRSNQTLLLDDKQVGHVRRIRNLAAQLPDDWSGMMGRSSLQEDFGALRFQLAYMAYALGLAHVHRLPAAPAVFRKPFEQLIAKMLSPDVWTYWHYVSTGNGLLNKSLGELPPQWNPVEADNIMYSAYVQSMALMFHYLFDDPKYAAEGALTMRLQPLFWGGDGQHFPYDERKINEHLYWTMVQKGYLGIACEPNCVFQICNQVPILGFRLHDMIYGGDVAREVTDGYLRAWSEFGLLDPNGHYNIVVQEREHALVRRPPLPWADFWLGALMHAWNPEFVKTNYQRQIERWSKHGPDGTLWIQPAIPPTGFGKELSNARDLGWAAACASEVGDADTLQRLLAYADQFLNPVWQDGAYFYQRRDGWFDQQGQLRAMDPHTGNALLAYARLNVPDGLHKLYSKPWDASHFREPALVDIPDDLDVCAAQYDAGSATLWLNMRADGNATGSTSISVGNVWDRGDWTLQLDDETVGRGSDRAPGTGSSIAMRREADNLLIACPASPAVDLRLTWHSSVQTSVPFLAGAPTECSFTLTDHHGRGVTDADYRGRFLLVYFGFTHCRVVCPRSLARLSEALSLLDKLADRIQPLYVTVDPARDTPGVMKAYLETQYPRFTGLTGTPEQVDAAKCTFRVFAQRAADPNDPSGYAVPHSALSYLVGPDGRYVAHFSDTIDRDELARRLRELIIIRNQRGELTPT